VPKKVTVYVGATDLWLKALARPEAEMKCRAAQAISLAGRRKVRGLAATVPALLRELDRPNQHPTVRLEVAQALIVLNARQAAGRLLEQVRSGDSDFQELVEPALAAWNYRQARALWLARLENPAARPRSLVRAIQALGRVREGRAVGSLRRLVLSDRAGAPVRLEAANVLGSLRIEGLEPDAARLAADRSPRRLVARLAAVKLLQEHTSEQAAGILWRLMRDSNPVVAAPAAARLIRLDPSGVASEVNHLLAGPASLRMLAVLVVGQQPTKERLPLLIQRLGDADPAIRVQARRALEELGRLHRFKDQVSTQAMTVLRGGDWRNLEQAAILLVNLKHRDAAPLLVKRLTFDRPEVYIAAAWGLRRLADPQTLAPVLHHVREKQQFLRDNADRPDATFGPLDQQLSQLNQFLGRHPYTASEADVRKEVEAALREFIPRMEKPMKSAVAQESRAAAVWALGLLNEGKPVDNQLAKDLEERLNDVQSLPREDVRVCRMCAVSLGRMKAQQVRRSLERYCMDRKPSFDPVHNACGWALERLAGRRMLPPGTEEETEELSFFLTTAR
jgi:HEAT repeat protein